MDGDNHRLRRSCRTIIAMAALVLLLAAVSHAAVSLDQVVKQTLDTTTGLVSKISTTGTKKTSVPEPSADLLLLIGIGVTGLVGSWVQRRKQLGT